MQLFRAQDAPLTNIQEVFRQGRVGPIIMTAFFLVLGIASLASDLLDVWEQTSMPGVVVLTMSMVSLVFSLLVLPNALAVLGEGNWVLRYDPERIALHVRSYRNTPSDDESENVVVLPIDLLESVGTISLWRPFWTLAPWTNSPLPMTWLELRVPPEASAALEAVLEREYARVDPTGKFDFHHHYPVGVAGPGKIWVQWWGPHARVHPGIRAALTVLSASVPVNNSCRVGGTIWHDVPELMLQNYVREPAQSPFRRVAMSLVRHRYGLKNSEAKKTVKTLRHSTGLVTIGSRTT